MIKRILPIFVVCILLVPVLTDTADALFNIKTYNWSGSAYVSKSYRYVGFTPEKITIKTTARWDKSPFSQFHLYKGKMLTVKLYSWATYPYKHWFVEAQKTYYEDEFTVKAYKYSKSWWDALQGRYYVKFVIEIPKDRDFYHHNSGKTKIWVKVKVEGSNANLYRPFESEVYTIYATGMGSYYTKSTPWEKYKKYWGYSMSVQDYNNLVANDNGTGISAYEELDTFQKVWIGLFIVMIVIAVPVVYNHLKKRG